MSDERTMEPPKPEPSADPAVFFHLWVNADGGLNYELNTKHMPTKVSELFRTAGGIGLTLYQLNEWLSAVIRQNAAAAFQKQESFRELLESLDEEQMTAN